MELIEVIDLSSSESNCSLTFHQNIVSSAVKEDVNIIRSETKKNTDLNRRRLCFSSSKDGCSESGKSDTKPGLKTEKPVTKKRKKQSPNFKPNKKAINQPHATKIEVDGLIEPDAPRSVGKSRTPKTRKSPRLPKTEEVLRKKDFKMPKCKTPSKGTSSKLPSSPAPSFLSSLSEMAEGLPCHPEAAGFKKEFKTRKEELAQKLFCLYNKEVFDSQLPADMSITWKEKMQSYGGSCYNKRIHRGNDVFRASRIVLSSTILDRPNRLRDTLIHELCHAAAWIIDAVAVGHGATWKVWTDKANRRFPELPGIKPFHNYPITKKYTYKCMTCGYCMGRHSKSLNTERKCCGYCGGDFKAFLTSKMASSAASVTSGSDSVRTGATRAPSGLRARSRTTMPQ